MDEFSVFRSVAQVLDLPPLPEVPTVATIRAVLIEPSWLKFLEIGGTLGLFAVAAWQAWLLRQSNKTAKEQNEILINQLVSERKANEDTLRIISEQTKALVEQNAALLAQLKIERAKLLPVVLVFTRANSTLRIFLINESHHDLKIGRAGIFVDDRESFLRSPYSDALVLLKIDRNTYTSTNPASRTTTLPPGTETSLYVDGYHATQLASLIGRDDLMLAVEAFYPHAGVVHLVCPISVTKGVGGQPAFNTPNTPQPLEPIDSFAPSIQGDAT